MIHNVGNNIRRFKPARTRNDWFNRRMLVWICAHCNTWHKKQATNKEQKKPSECTMCGSANLLYFASDVEAKRYAELRLMQRLGEISKLSCQQSYPLLVNGYLIGTYRADFVYESNGTLVIEDVKGKGKEAITDIFKLKCKLMKALYNIDIKLVKRS